MKYSNFFFRIVILMIGLLIMSLGIALYLKSGFGANPLTAFTEGFAYTFDYSVGEASQLIMLFTMILIFFIDRKRIGIGTIINAIFTGIFIDWFMLINFNNYSLVEDIILLILGVVIFSIGLGMYVKAGLGEGAVDAFMIIIQDKFQITITISRIILDVGLVILGWLLGGTIGIGTVAGVVLTGPLMNKTMKIMDNINGGLIYNGK